MSGSRPLTGLFGHRFPSRVQGLDTDAPELVLGDGSKWKGRYEESLGTTMFFGLDDPGGSSLQGQTELRLVFSRLAEVAASEGPVAPGGEGEETRERVGEDGRVGSDGEAARGGT